MSSRKKQRKEVKRVLQDENLQQALKKAASHHFQKFSKTKKDVPWEEYKKRAREIKEECIKHLPDLIQRFSEEARKAGAHVYQVSTPTEALELIEKIARQRNAKLIVKSKSMVSEEIGLNSFLDKKGYKVVETDLGEWIIQLAKERPSHITAPALHKTKQEVAELLSQNLQRPIPSDSKEIVRVAREELQKYFIQANLGISGANLAVAESGTLVIISNEGNARLVTSLPPVHVALVTTEKFVETLEQATSIIKALTIASSGLKLTSYVSFITGPSRTTDIEKELVIGVHGPQEVHIIILDNKRLAISKDKNLDEALYCLKCGGCMLVCPVFQCLGGHVYGGPVYPGGIGILLTRITESFKDSSSLFELCADCKKCEEFCPVGIPISNLILKLKSEKGTSFWEKALSGFFRKKSLAERGAKILSALQKPWKKNGHLKKLPFAWAKGKSFPALNLKKIEPSTTKNRLKVYLFEGCLVKFFFPEIRESIFSSLPRFGFDVVRPSDQRCCGAPSLHLGQQKDVHRLATANLKSFERENPDYILTLCPTGNSMLKKYYPEIEAKFSLWTDKIFDFTEFMVKKEYFPKPSNRSQTKDIFYHFPCHYINDLKLKEEPKKILQSLGFKLKEEQEPFSCCGFCGVFSLRNPEISAHMWEKKKQKILEKETHLIATDCPGCLLQLRANLKKEGDAFRIFHTAELYAKEMGEISKEQNNDRN
ncbi:MAG: LUD domain-containing protein [Candidatus Aminicenantes bacterium]|nr:MAG: LUD domain-containing protein [Candidatus Aminicenantes bacterium]